MEKRQIPDVSFNDWVQEQKNLKKFSIKAFVTLLIISSSLIIINEEISVISAILLTLCFLSFLAIRGFSKQSELDFQNDVKKKKIKRAIEIETKRKEREKITREKSSQQKQEKQKEADFEKNLESEFRAVEIVNDNLNELSNIEIPNISDFKNSIIQNEQLITTKGGDSVLQSFMKINTFLNDIVHKLKLDQKEIGYDFNLATIKIRIREDAKRNDIDKIAEQLADMSAKFEGRKGTGFNSKLELLINLGAKIVPSFQKEIENLQFYHFMGLAMISFYINDKKIQYFEIHEAFEKLGVFDSSWQKNVLSKLDSIENRLANIENQITILNKEFKTLNQNSESILLELKQIEKGINANNVLMAITAYQTWRINKKLN